MTLWRWLKAWLKTIEAKQGQNPVPSQITERPPPPRPMKAKRD